MRLRGEERHGVRDELDGRRHWRRRAATGAAGGEEAVVRIRPEALNLAVERARRRLVPGGLERAPGPVEPPQPRRGAPRRDLAEGERGLAEPARPVLDPRELPAGAGRRPALGVDGEEALEGGAGRLGLAELQSRAREVQGRVGGEAGLRRLGEELLEDRHGGGLLTGSGEEPAQLGEELGPRRRGRLGEGGLQERDGLGAARAPAKDGGEPDEDPVAGRRLGRRAEQDLERADRRRGLSTVGEPLGLDERLVRGEGRDGQAVDPREVLHGLPRRLAPARGGRLDPPAPEIQERLRHLALRRPGLGEPNEHAPRFRVIRRPGEEAPRLALGVRPPAEAEGAVGGRQDRGRGEDRVGEAIGQGPEALEGQGIGPRAHQALGRVVGRVVGEDEPLGQSLEEGLRPLELAGRQAQVSLAIDRQRARRRHPRGHGSGRRGEARAGEHAREEEDAQGPRRPDDHRLSRAGGERCSSPGTPPRVRSPHSFTVSQSSRR